jgi:CBS domain-containing protein
LDDPVSKYMSRELVTIDINNSVWQAAKLMKDYKVGSVFVTQNDNPVGILTERDVLYKIVAEDLPSAHVLLRKVMSSPLVSIDENSPARKAMELMRDKGFRRLLVTDKGKPSGLLTQDALVSRALR